MAKKNTSYTFLDFAKEVLETTKDPMTAAEIWDKGSKYGFHNKMTGRKTGTNSESSMNERMTYAVIKKNDVFCKAGTKAQRGKDVTLYGLLSLKSNYETGTYSKDYKIKVQTPVAFEDYLTQRGFNNLTDYKLEFNRTAGKNGEAHLDKWLKATDEERENGTVSNLSYWGWTKNKAKYKVGEKCLSFVDIGSRQWLLVSAGEILDVPPNSHAKVKIINEFKPFFGKVIVQYICGQNYVIKHSSWEDQCLFVYETDEMYKKEFNEEDNTESENTSKDKDSSKGKIGKTNIPLNQILYGPPGTGKTYNTVIYAVAICEDKKIEAVEAEDYKEVVKRYKALKANGRIEFVTFHQSYGYEEFIQGIKPYVDDGKVLYKVENGIFKQFCETAWKNPDKKYVFIIDEINRGNVSKIFGELITLIEEKKRIGAKEEMRVKLPYNGEEFGVPNNVYILGTMNTADRSLVQLDAALRRRFRFIEMMPNAGLLKEKVLDENNDTCIDLERLLTAINERICELIDREHQIGHSYLIGVKSLEELRETFKYEIIPLLQEYFYEDNESIATVLNGQSILVGKTQKIDVENLDFKKIYNGDKEE